MKRGEVASDNTAMLKTRSYLWRALTQIIVTNQNDSYQKNRMHFFA